MHRKIKRKNEGWDFFPPEIPRINWNPITGCPNLKNTEKAINLDRNANFVYQTVGCSTPDGKSYCYMAEMCNRFPEAHKPEFRFHENRMGQIAKLKKPHIVVVGSAGDMWGWTGAQSEVIRLVIEECVRNPQHFYIFLTRFPENYQKIYYKVIPFPPNVMFGVTITRQENIHKVKELYFADKINTFIMFEPLLMTYNQIKKILNSTFSVIDLVVIGALNSSSNSILEKWLPSEDAVIFLTLKAKDRKTPVYHKEIVSGYFEEPLKEYPDCILKWWEAQNA